MEDGMIGYLLDIKCSIELLEMDLNEKRKLISKLNNFLMRYCEHEIVDDYVDTSPDTGHNIKYCIHCGITMN